MRRTLPSYARRNAPSTCCEYQTWQPHRRNTSSGYCGNHTGLIIFDEPTQHSIGADDATAFFNSIVELNGDKQIIIGITVNTEEIKSAIENLDDNAYKYIHIGEKAFV